MLHDAQNGSSDMGWVPLHGALSALGRCTDLVKTEWDGGLAYETARLYQAAIALCTNASESTVLPPPEETCPDPPAERCCTRVLPSHSKRSNLRISFPAPVTLSSVSLWALPPAGTASNDGFQAVSAVGMDISLMSGPNGVMTGCAIDSATTAAEGRSGYTAQTVMCGPWSAGTEVVLGLPGLLGGAGLGVRVCTRDAGAAGNGNGNAVLYLAEK